MQANTTNNCYRVEFQKLVRKMQDNIEDEPHMHRSQFAHKWKRRFVLAFMKTQAQQMLQLSNESLKQNSEETIIPA